MKKTLLISFISLATILSGCGSESDDSDDSSSTSNATFEITADNYQTLTITVLNGLLIGMDDIMDDFGQHYIASFYQEDPVSCNQGSVEFSTNYTETTAAAENGSLSSSIDADECSIIEDDDTLYYDGTFNLTTAWEGQDSNGYFTKIESDSSYNYYSNSLYSDLANIDDIKDGNSSWVFENGNLEQSFTDLLFSFSVTEYFDMNDQFVSITTSDPVVIDSSSTEDNPVVSGSLSIAGSNDTSIEITISAEGYEITLNDTYLQTLDWDSVGISYEYGE